MSISNLIDILITLGDYSWFIVWIDKTTEDISYLALKCILALHKCVHLVFVKQKHIAVCTYQAYFNWWWSPDLFIYSSFFLYCIFIFFLLLFVSLSLQITKCFSSFATISAIVGQIALWIVSALWSINPTMTKSRASLALSSSSQCEHHIEYQPLEWADWTS